MQRVVGTVLKDSVFFLIQICNFKLFLSFLGEDYTYIVMNVNNTVSILSLSYPRTENLNST